MWVLTLKTSILSTCNAIFANKISLGKAISDKEISIIANSITILFMPKYVPPATNSLRQRELKSMNSTTTHSTYLVTSAICHSSAMHLYKTIMICATDSWKHVMQAVLWSIIKSALHAPNATNYWMKVRSFHIQMDQFIITNV